MLARTGLATVALLVAAGCVTTVADETTGGPGPLQASSSATDETDETLPGKPTADDAVTTEDSAGASNAASEKSALHGSLTTRLRYRRGRGDSDADIYSILSLDFGDEEHDDITGHVLGRVAKDFIGGTSADDPFHGLDDDDSSSFDARLYEAFVDLNRVGGFEKVRIGRQSLYETPEYVAFDGVMAVTEPSEDWEVQTGVFAGVPFHTYDSSRSGDEIGGAWILGRPWQGGRLRLDYQHIEDELSGSTDEGSDLLGVSAWQTLGKKLRVRGEYTRLDGKSRDIELAATYHDAANDLSVQISHKELLSTQRRLVTDLDLFYRALRDYHPYRESRLLVSKGIDEDYLVQAGATLRRLDDQGDEGTFNHDFDRYHVTGVVQDALAEDVSVSLTAEVWDADGGDSYATWGLDVTRESSEDLRMSAGMVYAKWKDAFLLLEERADVRTWYGRIRYKSDEHTTWSLGYDYEDSDVGNFQTLVAKMSWRF